MIEVQHLTKRYGALTAVEDLTFRAENGLVTGFLGPNGAGKTTTMRMILGLDGPSAGWARIDGVPLRDHAAPLLTVGALLNADSAAPTMTARAHLRWVARAGRIGDERVDEVLDLVGLHSAARRKIGGMSLGMRQRLGIATALLGDPGTLVLDEPINGLDPDGVLWVRTLLKNLAVEGRAVLVSSHLMSEMELTADRVVVVGQGRLVAEMPMSDLGNAAQQATIRVRAAEPATLLGALRRDHGDVRLEPVEARRPEPGPGKLLRITGLTAREIGDTAASAGTPVYELTPERASLEEVFMRLTHHAAEYVAAEPRTGALL